MCPPDVQCSCRSRSFFRLDVYKHTHTRPLLTVCAGRRSLTPRTGVTLRSLKLHTLRDSHCGFCKEKHERKGTFRDNKLPDWCQSSHLTLGWKVNLFSQNLFQNFLFVSAEKVFCFLIRLSLKTTQIKPRAFPSFSLMQRCREA